MADTIRELIIQGITTNLANILIANGYNTDCGQLIVRSQEIGDRELLPGIAIAPGQDTGDRIQYRRDSIEMPIKILMASAYEFDVDQTADKLVISQTGEKMLGDLRQAMGLSLSYVDDVIYSTGGIEEYPNERSNEITVVVTAEYNIKYQTVKNDPYNQ